MKILSKFSPKRLFKHKSLSVSRSDPASFRSTSSATSTGTPTSVLPSHHPDHIQRDLIEAFTLIDKDNDGKISLHDLTALLKITAPDPAPSDGELTAMLSEVDADGDGSISLEEFQAIGSAFEPACRPELQPTFAFFDRDGDGRITAEELVIGFRAIGDETCTLADCRRMVEGVSGKGSGFVCFDEFVLMMEQQPL